MATIRDANDHVLLTYRSFATVAGIVAALVSGIVAVAGFAATLFLLAEGEPIRAIAALILTIAFAFLIALLVPRVNVTLYDDGQPALTISQKAVFPAACYAVATPNGATLAELRKSVFSRLGRNHWSIVHEGRYAGGAAEESFSRALVRKLLGKFSRRFESNVILDHGGAIIRRPNSNRVDVLELTSDAVDRRVAVALATLVLGREP